MIAKRNKVHVETYGCTLNQSDSDLMKSALEQSGYETTTSESSADAVIINTCTVKGATENKIAERMKKLTKQGIPLVIAGCMSANERLIKKINPHAVIVGTTSVSSIAMAVNDALSGNPTVYKNREDKESLGRLITAPIMRIPICEGCTSKCHFCQTKIARPFLFSYHPKTILKWIEDGAAHGAMEIQLTAMDTGVYGMDIGTDLPALLDAICDAPQLETDGDFLVRLGMINPQHAKRMLGALVKALSHEKMYKFLHVPVQSGSGRVCKEMNRQHTVKDFCEVVDAVRAEIPGITIATDIIVGYPTETEADFKETVRLMEIIRPDITNISKFSPREGTVAKKMKQLPTQIVKERSARLADIVRKVQAEKNMELVGTVVSVLITGKQSGRHNDFTGRTNEYKQVAVKGYRGKIGARAIVKIMDANYGGLIGKMIKMEK